MSSIDVSFYIFIKDGGVWSNEIYGKINDMKHKYEI
jgi:hypothetical protein